LRDGDIVVTRFSSLIHEAIALGRPAIYFNPHEESVGYDFGAACAVLRHASTQQELTQALRELRHNPPQASDYVDYLRAHIRPSEKNPSVECAETIEKLVATGGAEYSRPGDALRRQSLLGYCVAEKFYLLWRGRL
jgi:CDP-glycerol glycerophosphotransferase (TagB/SpsB family)